MVKIAAFYIEKQKKVLFLKKIWFKPQLNWLQIENKPELFTDLIFSEGFDSN